MQGTTLLQTKRSCGDGNLPASKRVKLNPPEYPLNLPGETWQFIANWLDAESVNSLRLTARYFAADTVIHESFYQKFVPIIFDYKDEAELSGLMNPSEEKNFNKLIAYQDLTETFRATLIEVKSKLDHGEYSNKEASDAFLNAIKLGNIPLIKIFIESTTYPIAGIINLKNEEKLITALGHAAANCRRQIFSLLLQNGARFLAGKIVRFNDNHLVRFELGYYHQQAVTPLHIIALQSEENWLRTILDQFPETLPVFSESYKTHLRYILESDHQKLTASLKASNNLVLQEEDVACWSLLHWAACLGKEECVAVLINQGINVDVEAGYDDGLRPLDIACASGKLNTFKVLVAYGAAVAEEFGANGNNHLHLSAARGDIEFTAYLIQELRMDVTVKNENEETPLDIAQIQEDSEGVALSSRKIALKAKCAELLIKSGAVQTVYSGGEFQLA